MAAEGHDTITRCILFILVAVVVVTFLVCVAMLTIILLFLMPQNISAAEEGKVLIHVT